jgi:hypothetical protein
MGHTLDQTLVRSILEHATDFSWRMQEIGLLGLRLDERGGYRLHVWAPDAAAGDPVVHDHPYDFTSTVIVGELVNTRYVEDPHGAEHLRERYTPGNEDERRSDTVRLSATSERLCAGACYRQAAHELHDSRQLPGTVTVLHFDRFVDDLAQLTVCRRPDSPWVSAAARPATHDEVKRITALALSQFDAR